MIEIEAAEKTDICIMCTILIKAFFPGEEIAQKVDEKQEPLVTLTVDAGGSCFSHCAEKEVETGRQG